MRQLSHNMLRAFRYPTAKPSTGQIGVWVHWGLLLAFLPFAVLGWSAHGLMPGHDHSNCGHLHSHLAATTSACCHEHSHPHESHTSDHGTHRHLADGRVADDGLLMTVATGSSDHWIVPAPADHDCQICKLLSQLRTGVILDTPAETKLPAQTFAEWRIQNAKLAALSAYFLRGPPATVS